MGLNEDLKELSEYLNEDQLTEFVLRLIDAQIQFMKDTEDIPKESSKILTQHTF